MTLFSSSSATEGLASVTDFSALSTRWVGSLMKCLAAVCQYNGITARKSTRSNCAPDMIVLEGNSLPAHGVCPDEHLELLNPLETEPHVRGAPRRPLAFAPTKYSNCRLLQKSSPTRHLQTLRFAPPARSRIAGSRNSRPANHRDLFSLP